MQDTLDHFVNLSHQFSAAALPRTITARERAETEHKIHYLEKGQRAVTHELLEEEFKATRDDQLMYGYTEDQWGKCLVTAPQWDQLTEKERLDCRRNLHRSNPISS